MPVIPKWVPEAVADSVKRNLADPSLEDRDREVIRRLATAPRMQKVWREFDKQAPAQENDDEDSYGELRHRFFWEACHCVKLSGQVIKRREQGVMRDDCLEHVAQLRKAVKWVRDHSPLDRYITPPSMYGFLPPAEVDAAKIEEQANALARLANALDQADHALIVERGRGSDRARVYVQLLLEERWSDVSNRALTIVASVALNTTLKRGDVGNWRELANKDPKNKQPISRRQTT